MRNRPVYNSLKGLQGSAGFPGHLTVAKCCANRSIQKRRPDALPVEIGAFDGDFSWRDTWAVEYLVPESKRRTPEGSPLTQSK
jgi:hypothetical protein